MELSFEYSGKIGQGINPNLIQKPDGELMLFWLENGRLLEKSIKKEDIDFSSLYFDKGEIATSDSGLSSVRIKNVPRVGIFGVWTRDATEDFSEQQRFGIYEALSDVSRFLENGNISTSHDNAISSISLDLLNPNGKLNNETKAQIVPGMKIELMFSMGDSEDYPMGVFYVDRTSFEVGGNLKVDGRNLTGKLLKDQSFNDFNKFKIQAIEITVKAILQFAGIERFKVQESNMEVGAEFPNDMDLLTGLKEFIGIKPSWIITETLGGEVLIGDPNTFFPLQSLFSKYEFNRDNLISRGIVRDDIDVYSKVSVSSFAETYYVRTQPFKGDDVFTNKEVAEQFKERLKQEKNWDSRIETSSMSEETYRIFIGHFNDITVVEAKAFLISLNISFKEERDTRYNLNYLLIEGFGNAYGLSGHTRAEMVVKQIEDARKEKELNSWYMKIELEEDKRKWHKLWIGHFSKGKEGTLEPAIHWLKTSYSSKIGYFEVKEDKYTKDGEEVVGWVIKTGHWGNNATALSVQSELQALKGWYSQLIESGNVVKDKDGLVLSDTRRWHLEIKHFSRGYEGSLEKAEEFLETFEPIKWWQVKEDKKGFYIHTGLWGDLDGQLSIDRIKQAQSLLTEQTKLITGTGKGWYSRIEEVEKNDSYLYEDAWRLRIAHFNANTVRACESWLTTIGIWFRIEIDPSVPTKDSVGNEIPLPSNRMVVTGGFRNLNNRTGEERAAEFQTEVTAQGWYSRLEQFKIAKLDYNLWIGHFTQKNLPELKQYLLENNIDYQIFKEDEEGLDKQKLTELRVVKHEYDWEYAANKTYFLELPDNTDLEEMKEVADYLVDRFSKVGRVEDFDSIFAPYIICGDRVEVIQNNKRYELGTLTSADHSFGRNGYITKFTTDSGGYKGRDRISDLIEGNKASSNIKVFTKD